jgi:hypothetical protein
MADNEIKLIINADASGLDKATNSAVKSLTQINQASGKAQYALTNLSRVASDAPFGFIAIQNNLDPLISSFGQLQKETGSVGGALKALGGSLIGPAGIGLAFSIASAAFTAFQMGLFDSGKEAEKSAEKIRNSFQIIQDASASVQGEAAKVQVLSTIVQDVTKSYNERNSALEQLKKINQSYFGDITLEESGLTKLKQATDEYTNALVAQAVVKGFESEISKLSLELFKQREEFLKISKDVNFYTEARKKAAAETKNERNNLTQTNSQFQDYDNLLIKSNNDLIKQSDLLKETAIRYGNLQTGIKDAVTETLKYKPLDTKGSTKSANETTKALKEQKKALEDIFQIGVKLKGSVGKTEEPVITAAFIPNSDQTKADAQKIKDYYNTLNNAVITGSQVISQGVVDAFVGIGEAFGSTLGAGGGIGKALAAAGSSLLNIIGGVLVELGKKTIIASTLVQALQKALASLFTPQGAAAGLAIGIGLVALGSILKSIKLTKGVAFADGGIVTGPTRALIGEAGPEAVIPLSKLDNIVGGNQNIFVTGVLSGENIYLQQQRTSARRSRFV